MTPAHLIRVRYCGPTNTRGARWSLTHDGQHKIIPYEYERHNIIQTAIKTFGLPNNNVLYAEDGALEWVILVSITP